MKFPILFSILILSFPQFLFAQESNTASNEINVTIIRKGSVVGMANKWKVWLNGEELCKLKNASYCETTIKSDSLCLIGKIKGPAEINLIHVLSEDPMIYCSKDLDQSEYFFRVKSGAKSLEFIRIEEKEANKLLLKAKKKSN